MKKFIVIYHAPAEAWDPSNSTPEEREKSMAAWMQWAENCGDKLIDMGTPLMNGQQLSHDGTSKNSDKNVLGYSILQAEDMEDAKGLLAGHPHLVWDGTCSIEVHETMPLPGM